MMQDGDQGTRRRNMRMGSGAGFSSDRLGPAVDLAEKGALDWLVFETIGERTLASVTATGGSTRNAVTIPSLARACALSSGTAGRTGRGS